MGLAQMDGMDVLPTWLISQISSMGRMSNSRFLSS